MAFHARLGLLAASLALVAGASLPASATTYSVIVEENGFDVGPCNGATSVISTVVSDSIPVAASLVCGPFGGNITASGASGAGHTGTSLVESESLGGDGIAEATFSTLVTFSSLNPAAPQGPISVALNLNVNGILGVAGSADTGWDAGVQIASTAFSYSTSIDTGSCGVAASHGVDDLFFSAGGETFHGCSDFVTGTLTTPFVGGISLNTPVFVQFSLMLGGFGNPGAVTDLFFNSLDFPKGSDVFTLPNGYTANAPDVFLVNDRFAPPTTGVPEPITLSFFGAGLVGAMAMRRRRKSLA